MSDDPNMDTDPQQCVVSKERLYRLGDVLSGASSASRSAERIRWMEAEGIEAAVVIDGSRKVLQLNQSDIDALIKYCGLTWDTIVRYVSFEVPLVVGPFVLRGYPIREAQRCHYVLGLGFIFLSVIEELRQDDESHHHEAALQTLIKLHSTSSYKEEIDRSLTLTEQTQYGWLLQKCDIQVSEASLDTVWVIDDPGFVSWVVENVSTLGIVPSKLSDQAWAVFCETICGASSKVKTLKVFSFDQPSPPLSPSLAETVQKASTVEKLKIYISESGQELVPFLNKSFHYDHILHLKVSGILRIRNWLPTLSAIIKSDQFASIDYDVSVKDDILTSDHMDSFEDVERDRLINEIRQAKTLTNLSLNTFHRFGVDFQTYVFEPIFKERKFQKRALKIIAPKLESDNKYAGLLGTLICHRYVRPHPDTLYGILRLNTASLRVLWDGGRTNRIARLEQVIERNMRELEASRTSNKRKLGD